MVLLSHRHSLSMCRSHTDMYVAVHTHSADTKHCAHTHIRCAVSSYTAHMQSFPKKQHRWVSIRLVSPTTHTHAWRQEQEALTDFLLGLGEREAAQLTHGASFPLLLFPSPCCYPSFSSAPCSKPDGWRESPASPPVLPSVSLVLLPSQRADKPSEDESNQTRKKPQKTLPLRPCSPKKTEKDSRRWKKMNEWFLALALLCTNTGRRGVCIRERERDRERGRREKEKRMGELDGACVGDKKTEQIKSDFGLKWAKQGRGVHE